jgi:hypothetical protein
MTAPLGLLEHPAEKLEQVQLVARLRIHIAGLFRATSQGGELTRLDALQRALLAHLICYSLDAGIHDDVNAYLEDAGWGGFA